MSSERAAPRAPAPMSRATAFVLVAFAFVITMLGTTLPTPLYPIYQEQYGFSNVLLTVVYATYAGGVIAALVLFGRLSDEVGRRRMMLLSLQLSAASAGVFLLASGVVMLLAGRALSGLAAGIMTGTATAALVDLAPTDRPRRASLVAAAANMGGLGLGPLLAGALAEYGPHPARLCFLVHLALTAVAMICLESLPEPRRVATKVRLRLQRPRVPPAMRATFIQAAVPGFAGFAVLGLFTAVSAALLGAVMDRSDHLLTGLLAGTGFAASLAGQAISTRTSDRRAMLAGSALLVVAAALVATSLEVTSLPLLLAAAVAAGVGQGMSFRAGLAMVTAASPTGQRAAVASSYFTTLYIALSIPVIGCGAGAQVIGWARSAIIFAVLIGLLPLVALVALLRPQRPRPPLQLAAGQGAVTASTMATATADGATAAPAGRVQPGLPAATWPRWQPQWQELWQPRVWMPPPRASVSPWVPLPLPLPAAGPRLQLAAAPTSPAPPDAPAPLDQPVLADEPVLPEPPLPAPWHLPPHRPDEQPLSGLPHPWRLPPPGEPHRRAS